MEKNGEASQWRVSYQRGLPHLVSSAGQFSVYHTVSRDWADQKLESHFLLYSTDHLIIFSQFPVLPKV